MAVAGPEEIPGQGLWMLHGKFYDLKAFIDQHPGGRNFIERTHGTDITTMYESHHPPSSLERRNALLKKYEVPAPFAVTHEPGRGEGSAAERQLLRTQDVSRGLESFHNADQYRWEPDGFYATLREKVWAQCRPDDYQLSYDVCSLTGLFCHVYLVWILWCGVTFTQGIACTAGLWLTRNVLFGAGHFYNHSYNRNYFEWMLDIGCFTPSFRWKYTHNHCHHGATNRLNDLEDQGSAQLRKTPLRQRLYFMAYMPFGWLSQGVNDCLYSHDGAFPPWYTQIATAYIVLELLLMLAVPGRWYYLAAVELTALWIYDLVWGSHHTEHSRLEGRVFEDWGEETVACCPTDPVFPFSDTLEALFTIGGACHTAHHLFPTFNAFALYRVEAIIDEHCKDRGVPRNKPRSIWRLTLDVLKFNIPEAYNLIVGKEI